MRLMNSIFPALVFSCVIANALADESSFSGIYRVNGKEAKLNHITVKPANCMFADGIAFVLSEKEITGKPDEKYSDVAFDAQMGSFGDALAVQVCLDHETWKVARSNLSHFGLKHSSGKWEDQLKVEGMTFANGEYSGRLVSIAGAKLFNDGQPLEVNITFKARL